MNRLFFGICILLLLYPLPSAAQYEGKSRYVTLVYSDKELLHDFNDQLILGRKLRYHLANKTIITVEDEVLAKLDTIIEKAETVLDMFPDKLHVTVVLLPSKKEVGAMYFSKYGNIVKPAINNKKNWRRI